MMRPFPIRRVLVGFALRDEHLAAVVADLARRGERVFAITGSSHAVKLEAAARARLLTRL